MRRLIPPLSRDQWFIYFSQMTWGFSAGLWLHLQPLYIRSLGADPKEVGATLSLAGLLVIFVYVPVSILADRWRRKPIIVSAWVMGTVATLLIGLAPDWRWVIPALALNLLSSFSRPAVAAHVAATDVSDNPSRTFAFMWTGFAMGNIISPSLGGWIAEVWGLRAVFFVAAGVSAVSTFIMWQLSDESAPLRQAESGGGLRQVLGDRPFLWQMGLMLSIVFALELGTVFAPNYLQDVKGLSLRNIGQLGTVASFGMFTLTLVLGYMRNDRRKPLVLNQVLVLSGLLCLLFAPVGAPSGIVFHPLLLAGYFFRGGSRAVVPLTRGRVSGWLPPEALNVGFGLVDTAAQTATLLAPLAAGFLYDQHPSWPLIGGVVALMVTMTLTLATRTVRPINAKVTVT
ncbi:MAG: MFS transporter [Anaerolineales bacterium]